MNHIRVALLAIGLAFIVMPFSNTIAGGGAADVGGAKCPAGQTMPLIPGECMDASELHATVCGNVTLVLGTTAVVAGTAAAILFLTGAGVALAGLLTGVSWITGLISAGVGSVCVSLASE